MNTCLNYCEHFKPDLLNSKSQFKIKAKIEHLKAKLFLLAILVQDETFLICWIHSGNLGLDSQRGWCELKAGWFDNITQHIWKNIYCIQYCVYVVYIWKKKKPTSIILSMWIFKSIHITLLFVMWRVIVCATVCFITQTV